MGSNNRHGSRLDFAKTNRSTQYPDSKRKLTKSSQLFFERKSRLAKFGIKWCKPAKIDPNMVCGWVFFVENRPNPTFRMVRAGEGGTGPNVGFRSKTRKHPTLDPLYRFSGVWYNGSVLRQGGARRRTCGRRSRPKRTVGGEWQTQGSTGAALGRLRGRDAPRGCTVGKTPACGAQMRFRRGFPIPAQANAQKLTDHRIFLPTARRCTLGSRLQMIQQTCNSGRRQDFTEFWRKSL